MSKVVSANVQDWIAEALEVAASKENRSLSNIIETLLIEALKVKENRTMDEKRGDSN